MRESNYRSVSNNRAAVTITTSLYDRRALDVTADKPLVNLLNHLTYLVSLSAKVRETLSNDGGIERLVEILHECHNSTFNVNDNIFNSEKKLLTAWKWTLAFQCLILIGTGGTERIRQKVVKAGMLPIIATVLDNYMGLHEGALAPQMVQLLAQFCPIQNQPGFLAPSQVSPPELQFRTFVPNSADRFPHMLDPYAASRFCAPAYNNFHLKTLTAEDFDCLTVDQLFKLICLSSFSPSAHGKLTARNDIRRRFLIATAIRKLRIEKERESPDPSLREYKEYDMDNNLHFLSDLYLQYERTTQMTSMIHSKIAPRNFTETGVLIPRDDDVVWCLQLLAYISKYPYLKDVLQNTHMVIDMSIRDKHRKTFIGGRLRPKFTNLATGYRQTLIPRSRKGRIFAPGAMPSNTTAPTEGLLERYNPSPSNSPQMPGDLGNAFDLADDNLDLYSKPDDDGLTEDAEANDFDDDYDELDDDSDHRNKTEDDEEVDEYLSNFEENEPLQNEDASHMSKLYDSIVEAEAVVDDLERELALVKVSEQVDRYIELESRLLSETITAKAAEEKKYLSERWDYDTYDGFDIDEDDDVLHGDFDDSLVEYKKVNLFPMVEKFTFLAGTDMYYWSGVIMRNSCRRNDMKGGVRQCGNLECGKWERYPREFSKCKKCKRTKYCSRECQMRAWHCHKNWCVPSSSSSSTSTHTSQSQDRRNGQPRPAAESQEDD